VKSSPALEETFPSAGNGVTRIWKHHFEVGAFNLPAPGNNYF
jgi:hypothetical protein